MSHPFHADFHVHTHLSPCGKPEATADAMIRSARRMGARFTLTADAHHPDDLHRWTRAWEWAQRMGMRETDILSITELLQRQAHRKAETRTPV